LVSSYLPPVRQQRRKPPPGPARARVVSTELLDQFGVDPDRPVAALDLSLARGNPLRRLLVGSKGRLGVVCAVHDGLLEVVLGGEVTQRVARRASGFPG
jgi:hypothetical protein